VHSSTLASFTYGCLARPSSIPASLSHGSYIGEARNSILSTLSKIAHESGYDHSQDHGYLFRVWFAFSPPPCANTCDAANRPTAMTMHRRCIVRRVFPFDADVACRISSPFLLNERHATWKFDCRIGCYLKTTTNSFDPSAHRRPARATGACVQ
jgi:hypothetical protein